MTIVRAIKAAGPKSSTHQATCPDCKRPTLIRFMKLEANIRQSCQHFEAIIRTGDQVEVEFSVDKRAAVSERAA